MSDTVGATEPVQDPYDRDYEQENWDRMSEDQKNKILAKNEYLKKRFAEKPIVDNMVDMSIPYKNPHYPPKAAPLFLEFDKNREMVAVQVDEETYRRIKGTDDQD